MPTGTRVCGCPSRRCSCGYDAARKAGISSDMPNGKVKGKRRRIDRGVGGRAEITSNGEGKPHHASHVENGKQDTGSQMDKEPGLSASDADLACGCSPNSCNCAANNNNKKINGAENGIGIKDEPVNQSADTKPEGAPGQATILSHRRSSSVRTCGCPARKCRCGAGGRIIGDTPRSYALLQSNRQSGSNGKTSQICSFEDQKTSPCGTGESLRSLGALTDGGPKKLKVEETFGCSSGLADEETCSCGNNGLCHCRADIEHSPKQGKGIRSAKLDKVAYGKENERYLHMAAAEGSAKRKDKFKESERDTECTDWKRDILQAKKKSGPGTGRRACGCPSRICRCGAQTALADAYVGGRLVHAESPPMSRLSLMRTCL